MANDTKLCIGAAIVVLLVLFVAMRPPLESPQLPRVDPRVDPSPAGKADVTTVSDDAPAVRAYTVRRNLFAYEEPPRVEPVRRPVRHVEPQAIVIPTDTSSRIEAKPAEQPPEFSYRYIGRFGPDANPIAAFARNGEIVDARPGDVIAERFILRRIGLESVEIAYVGFAGELRVPVASGPR